jgi:hypothetical protein
MAIKICLQITPELEFEHGARLISSINKPCKSAIAAFHRSVRGLLCLKRFA